MINKGEIIVAMDPDLRDMYYCEAVRGDEENKRNILCRVLSMAQYPIQHAILDGSIANENPPLGEGQTARLKFVRRVETMDKYYHNYASSVSRCLDEYAKKRRFLYESLKDQPPALRHGIHCPDAKELEILERHARGEYSGRRAVINH